MNKLLLPLFLLGCDPQEISTAETSTDEIVVAERALFSEDVLTQLAANGGLLMDKNCILKDKGKNVEIACK